MQRTIIFYDECQILTGTKLVHKYVYEKASSGSFWTSSNHKDIIDSYAKEGWRFVTAIPSGLTFIISTISSTALFCAFVSSNGKRALIRLSISSLLVRGCAGRLTARIRRMAIPSCSNRHSSYASLRLAAAHCSLSSGRCIAATADGRSIMPRFAR